MLEALLSVVQNMILAPWNAVQALISLPSWLSWLWNGLASTEDKQALMRFIYYGASKELFFVLFDLVLVLTVVGMIHRPVLWGAVRVMEGFANTVGRVFAWAGLIMVLQQIMIVFVQRIFAASEISVGLGLALTKEVSWWAEGLKLYNAIVVALCATYTFVQGGHVRVDLIYAKVSRRARKLIDMFGSVVFMLPVSLLVYFYGWFFLWRHLVTPKVSASDTIERLLLKARLLKWNVETIGFSPNGFNAYFLFKILLVSFAVTVFIQGLAFFYRNWLEWKEGPEADGRYLDRDTLGAGEEIYEGTH